MNAPASDQHFIIRAIGQVNDFRWHLGGETKQICSPRAFRHDLPTLPSGYGARGLVMSGPQFPPERRIDLGMS